MDETRQTFGVKSFLWPSAAQDEDGDTAAIEGASGSEKLQYLVAQSRGRDQPHMCD